MINAKSIFDVIMKTTRLFLLLIVILSSQAHADAPFHWDYINVDIDVQENGDMLITEEHK